MAAVQAAAAAAEARLEQEIAEHVARLEHGAKATSHAAKSMASDATTAAAEVQFAVEKVVTVPAPHGL